MSSSSLNQNGDRVDPIHVDSEDANIVHILSDCDDDASEEQEIAPRIGDKYQAELPPRNRVPDDASYAKDVEPFMMGLPIPLTWIKCRKHGGAQTISESNDIGPRVYGNGDIERRWKCCVEGYALVPGLPSASWSDAEKASFLLALYIFEKNFVEVRRFVETKDMGAILAYYYGDFCESDEYVKWSEGRKTSKKSVHGHKIFSGIRQQELLSRLMHRVPEEFKSAVLEVIITFNFNSLVKYRHAHLKCLYTPGALCNLCAFLLKKCYLNC